MRTNAPFLKFNYFNYFPFDIIIQMPERKVWTEQQDKILRYLRQERKQRKWANIARIMQQQFNIQGRTGKQCRERFHNHLDSSIVNTEWTIDEEEMLFELHEEIGNKWSIISQRIPGRSDNCVKNHFYSKLRKAVRKLNKIIQDLYSEEYRQIKGCMLSKIIEITESKFKTNSKEDQEFVLLCNDIKNRLFKLQISDVQALNAEESAICKELIEDIEVFDKDYRKNHKSSKKYANESQYKIYLKPPKPILIKRQMSNGSCSSEFSDDGSSFLSSASGISSCSDLSQYDNQEKKNTSSANSTRSLRNSSANSIQNLKVQSHEEEIRFQPQDPQEFQRVNDHLIEQQSQNNYAQLQQKSLHYEYNNMFYDDTPVMARIFAPYSNMDEQPESVLFQRQVSEEQQIIYAEQKHEK